MQPSRFMTPAPCLVLLSPTCTPLLPLLAMTLDDQLLSRMLVITHGCLALSLPHLPSPINHNPLKVGVDLSCKEMAYVQLYLPCEHLKFIRTEHNFPLWIVAQVERTSSRSAQVREPAVTGCVNMWEPAGSGSLSQQPGQVPLSLPPRGT